MRLRISAAAIGLALVLAGCVSSRGLHPTGGPIDAAQLKSDQALGGLQLSPAAWPAQDWWTGLGDQQLNALIDEALQNNPSLAIADARAREAQAQLGSAAADRGPSVKGGGAVNGARIPTTMLPEAAGGGHFAVAKYADANFSWDLDLWGGKRAAWEAALGQSRAAEIERRAARIEVSVNVARGYVQLGYAYAQQDVARAELTRSNTARQLTRQRVAAGVDSQIQLKQIDSEVASAEQQSALADRAIDSARSALAVLLGKGPDRGLQIIRPRGLAPSALMAPPELPVELLGHRADLTAARWRVEAAGHDIKAAKAQFLPNVSLGALAGFVALGGGTNLAQLPARFYNVGPSISLPLFDGGKLRANLAGRDAAYDEAIAQYNKTLVQAVNEVADDFSARQSLDVQLAAQQRALDAANAAWQLAQQRYQAGIGSYLEALSVRQQLLSADQRMASLRAQQLDLSIQLIQALGGGFRPQADETFSSASSPNPRS